MSPLSSQQDRGPASAFERFVDRSDRTKLLIWSLFLGLGLLLIESVYLHFKQGPFLGALGFWVVPLTAAYLGAPLLLAFSLAGRVSLWKAFAIIAVIFYAIESTKMFVIGAPLLGRPAALAAFLLVSLLMFIALLFISKRLSLDPSTLIWFVWVYVASCYAVAFQWRTVGGDMTVFLRSPRVLTIVALGAILFLCVVWISRQARRSLVAGAAGLATATAVVAVMSGSASTGRSLESAADKSLPDIYVASFDALGREVFDRWCTTSDGAAAKICSRGLRFENIVADGLATYEILRANTYGDRSNSSCGSSVVGLTAARGYETSMWLGRKGVRIKGADCYDHYFSGRGRDIATRFALPAVTDHLWKALYSGSVDSREEFIESETILSELSARLSNHRPHFAYLHFLDLHAPYRPRSLTEPSAHEEKMGRFMDSCYRVGCDLSANEALIAYARSAFERSLPDVDRHLSQLLKIAESRKRPYVLIVTADHGELFGQYDGFGHTGGFVPELLSVPFVVYDSRYDYRAAQDCVLALSSSALHGFVQRTVNNDLELQPGKLLSAPSSVEVHDSLG
ncbi:MAG: LTA synthase family protein, partial [Deltaproteobacteria bacterium]|nr:LTA synthase family protein [Deltaproteobacteria bacterium]